MNADRPPNGRGTGWLLAAAAVAVVTGVLVAFLPMVEQSSTGGTGGTVDQRSLVETEGWQVVALFAVPVALCLVPLLARHRRRPLAVAAAVAFGLLVAISAASVGLLYVPALAALAVAAWRQPDFRSPKATGDPPAA
jgi:hypothetical protein